MTSYTVYSALYDTNDLLSLMSDEDTLPVAETVAIATDSEGNCRAHQRHPCATLHVDS